MIKLLPLITEKGLAGVKKNCYIFKANFHLNRPEIKKMVEKEYGVKVISVRTLNQLGKQKRVRLKRQPGQKMGQRSDFKKAFIRIKAGQKIKQFDVEPDKKEVKETEAKVIK